MNPNDAKREFDRADALYRAGRFAEALQVLDQLDALHPFNKAIMYPRALCLAGLGRAEEAAELCDQLFALHQDTRALELKSRLQDQIRTAPPAAAKGKAKAASRGGGGGFQIPVKGIGIAVAVVCVLGAAYFLLQRSGGGGPADAPKEGEKAASGAVAAEQEKIDKAMREHMETSSVPPFTSLYDTGTPSKEPLSIGAVKSQSGWTQVPEDQPDYAFKGDAVLMNNQIMVVLRKEGGGAEVWGRNEGFQNSYANLVPSAGTVDAQGAESFKVVKCGQDEVTVEAAHRAGATGTMKVTYQLSMGQVFVKVAAVEKATKLRVEAPCRFTVLPDFFADDIVIDAKDIETDRADLPSENFLLHMTANGDALVMNVWENRDQDVKVVFAGQGTRRQLMSSEIAFGKDGAIWVALLTDTGVWSEREVALTDKGQELALNWQWPYPALWRVDWQYVDDLSTDKLTDSWEMLTENADGSFKKHGMFQEEEDSWTAQDWWGSGERTRIASGLGRFQYPCWVDRSGQGWLQPLSTDSWQGFEPMNDVPIFQGPTVIYPINRIKDTPLDKFTVVDVVRASLGVGPCQYILDVEGQSEQFKGLPTCAVRDILDEIYENGEQKQRREEVEKSLTAVVEFITMIRGRIEEYAAFSKEMQAYLDESKPASEQQKRFVEKMKTLTARIDTAIAKNQDSIKSVKFASDLADDFRSDLVGYTGTDAEEKCKNFTKAWVDIGGHQDVLVAECRVAVKRLRQRAALGMTADPTQESLVKEIRTRSEKILRAPVNYEAPRH